MVETNQDKITVQGFIRHIVFRNEETGFVVAAFSSDTQIAGLGSRFNVVGVTPEVSEDECVEVSGVIEENKYGFQLKFEYMKPVIPKTKEGVLALLQSNFLPITKPVAKRLVDAFGEQVFAVLEESPDEWLKVKGILPAPKGRQKVNNILPYIIDVFNEKKVQMDVAEFCAGIGLSPAYAVKVFQTFGNNSIKIIQANPYNLTSVRGIGFKIADKAALGMGVAVDDMRRVQAGVKFIVDEEAVGAGSCGLPVEDAVSAAAENLGVDESLCRVAVDELIKADRLKSDTFCGEPCVFSKPYYNRELEIAGCLVELKNGKPLYERTDIDAVISSAENDARRGNEHPISLDPNQRAALVNTLKNKVSIITGGPGVGKTTIIRVLLSACTRIGVSVCLLAPTGRAAKRMSEATGSEAYTVHRRLGAKVHTDADGKSKFGFSYNASQKLPEAFYVVDETSMLDVLTLRALLIALPSRAHIVFVGDVDQLPSVGAGNVLGDMISSEVIPTSRLTTIFRQAQTSLIVKNAHAVNHGMEMNLNYGNDMDSNFFYIRADAPEEAAHKIREVVKRLPKRLGFDDDDVQVLAPMKKGAAGVDELNKELQYLRNVRARAYWGFRHIKENGDCCGLEADACAQFSIPPVCVENKFQRFFEGDKVMQTKNDYDKGVFNGDAGRISRIDPVDGKFYVVFDDDQSREVEYSYHKGKYIPELMLAYACTIHKSQGNEFPVVVMPVLMSHWIMLKRKLLYTGITRGKKVVVLVGNQKAIHVATSRVDDDRRVTKLCDFLMERGGEGLFANVG